MTEFITASGLARRLGVAELTVRRWIKGDKIPSPSVSLGNARGYPPEQIEEIVAWFQSRQGREEPP